MSFLSVVTGLVSGLIAGVALGYATVFAFDRTADYAIAGCLVSLTASVVILVVRVGMLRGDVGVLRREQKAGRS